MTSEQKSRELRHLIEANNHLAAASVRIAVLEQHVHASDGRDDARETSRLLSAMRRSFEAMCKHRAVIEDNMKRI